jgi:serine/threonine-protein kinase RsbW
MTQEGIIYKLELASKLESLTRLETYVDELCEQFSISEDDYGNILIAITEAVNNAITHGNQLNPDKKVCLNFDGNQDEVEFIVEDEGNGFDYNNVPDPTLPENLEKLSGRGIFLMKNLADDIAFENDGTKIRLKFSISAN